MLSCQFRTRFPDDAQITPTTLAFIKTPMEATHDLITELTFFDAKTTATRDMRYKRAVILAPVGSRAVPYRQRLTLPLQCTLIAEAVMLPAYGDDKVVEREDFQPVRPKDREDTLSCFKAALTRRSNSVSLCLWPVQRDADPA